MRVKDFLTYYQNDGLVGTIAKRLQNQTVLNLHLKGVTGSLDAVLSRVIYQKLQESQLFILEDKEDANYFYSDLQNLLGEQKEVLFLPNSYKRLYEFEETDNANILMRAEVLNRINNGSDSGELIVTYPEALTERVINKRSLGQNTFAINKGNQLDVDFVTELLQSYGFEKADFVYEAGQFAVRGGIIDIFSFANELPYRVELFGDEIESIRTFDPENQLSIEYKDQVSIIPNVQTRLQEETRESFLNYIGEQTTVWIRDAERLFETLDLYFDKAREAFRDQTSDEEAQVVLSPDKLFETAGSFKELLSKFSKVEFGKRFYFEPSEVFQYESAPQPYFNKNFELLAQDIRSNSEQGITTYFVAESIRQIERIRTIFDEIDPELEFDELHTSLRQGFIDRHLSVACYTDHQLFGRYHHYKTRSRHSKSRSLTIKELQSLQPGDYVTHVDYGVGRFAGLEKIEVNGQEQEAVRLVYKDNDLLYVNIHSLHKISKYNGKETGPPKVNKLGSPEWENKKKRVKKKVKDIAKDLINLYAKRKSSQGYAFNKDGYLQAELESSFLYEDTPDQYKATAEVKEDMEKDYPMDRLVCGDVGFGKTEVAIRAAFKAVCDSKQVAVLVPTTILAIQHYQTFKERLEKFPVTIEYINRFKSSKEIKETLQRVKEGKTDIVIGTHRIISKDVSFYDLGLLVIDEEQKFGVKTKEKLKELKVNVDALTLTATPIPRTLHFSLMGARDLSVIATPPPNRRPVTTEIQAFNEDKLRDAVSFEVRRGGQVFFIHNRVSDIDSLANTVYKLVPDARIGIAHGQMPGEQLEKVMLKFVEGDYDVLVSTNIVESGLDIPNANTIIINQAHMFGLSDLHQMRGRVGRSNQKAYCYLLTPSLTTLPADARKRLNALEEFSELGDGFKVAMRDLDIRGAGNLLGGEQSGFVNDLGFDMYHKILDDAIKELKEEEFKDLFSNEIQGQDLVPDCNLETDLEIVIPDDYVTNITERLRLYTELDNIKDEESLKHFENSLRDMFGPVPDEVYELIKTVRLRWKAEALGIEKLILKKQTLRCQFISEKNEEYFKSETFGSILNFVQRNPARCRLKESRSKQFLVVEEVETIEDAMKVFREINEEVPEKAKPSE